MVFDSNKDRGRAGLSLAIAYFGANGYTVSIPMNDTQWYDLIVEKDGIFQTVQCKFTSTDNKLINFRSTGGTKGKVYDSVLNHPTDYLFCADKDMNLFLIPLEDLKIAGNKKSITLRTEPNPFANKGTFQTEKYLVHI